MPQSQILLFLHGVGTGDPENAWKDALERALIRVGYPDLTDIEVVAPKYPNGLKGVDDEVPLPGLTVPDLRGEAAKLHRLNFERRRTAMEIRLGRDDQGDGLRGFEQLAPVAADLPAFVPAKNYVKQLKIRAWVIRRILDRLPESGRIVLVGHSLGSVIAADLVRRLPPGLEVAGMVTIGSPLAQEQLHVDKLTDNLKEPPTNLAWWVNFWNTADFIPTRRGVSSVLPWVLDQRISVSSALHPFRAHEATTYLDNDVVARAIGFGLFGSQGTELALVEKGLDVPMNEVETLAVLALRYAHLTLEQLNGDEAHRYADALRLVQDATVEQIRSRNESDGRPTPLSITSLSVDLSDPDSSPVRPEAPNHLSSERAILPLIALATANVLRPFEIEVSEKVQQKAMSQLTLDIGLGSQLGTNLFEAFGSAHKELKGGTNWLKWVAVGVGAAAIAIATGGLALAAAPGVAGAAAITSALAAFGPGGMIGGLLTAGSIVGAGGGSLAIGLAAPGTTAVSVEAVVTAQLTAAILRSKQGLAQDPSTWANLVESEIAVRRELARLEPISDESAETPKELRRKLKALERAIAYLQRRGLAPKPLEISATSLGGH